MVDVHDPTTCQYLFEQKLRWYIYTTPPLSASIPLYCFLTCPHVETARDE